MNLFDYKKLLEEKPIHIATVSDENKPDLSVASNVRIIKEME